jgi:hypothetical protein
MYFHLGIARIRQHQRYVLREASAPTRATPAAPLLPLVSRVSSIATNNAHRQIFPSWSTITILGAPFAYIPSARKLSTVNRVFVSITQTSMDLRYANMTEKQPCIFELSTYSDINASGLGFLNTIVRDNCETARFFCDTTSQLCERLRLVGQQCQYHRDCQSVRFTVPFLFFRSSTESYVQYNCIRNVCANPPEEPFEVAFWQYVVTTLAVVAGKDSSLFHDDRFRRPVSEFWQQ